jgi:hypothetical protein
MNTVNSGTVGFQPFYHYRKTYGYAKKILSICRPMSAFLLMANFSIAQTLKLIKSGN